MTAQQERICSLLTIIAALVMIAAIKHGSESGTMMCAIAIVVLALLPLVMGRA